MEMATSEEPEHSYRKWRILSSALTCHDAQESSLNTLPLCYNTHNSSGITTVFPTLKNLKIPEKPKTTLIKSQEAGAWWNRELSPGCLLPKPACGRFLQAAGPAAPARFLRASPSGLASSFSFPRTISPYPCLPKPLPALPGTLTSGRFLACASELLLSQHPRACGGLSARPPFVSLPLPGHSSSAFTLTPLKF